MRYFSAVGLLLGAAVSQLAAAQSVKPTPSFYTTYHYTGYTVYDNSSTEPPTEVSGVGGKLTLRADGSYEKHMSIVAPSGPHYFNQFGRFVISGDSIRFTFTDLKGTDTQKGTFRFDPVTRHLTITIFGYPAGNKGVYELVANQLPRPDPARRPVKRPVRRPVPAPAPPR